MGFEVICGDALAEMSGLVERGVRVDACLTDPPYGTTACAWDAVIPFAPMWAGLKRVVKRDGAVVLFGSQPFTSALVMSNPQMFRYQWVWNKELHANFALAERQPLKVHEDITVFSQEPHAYFPIKVPGARNHTRAGTPELSREYLSGRLKGALSDVSGMKFPRSILDFPKHPSQVEFHTNQKPVDLMRYLVRTYTNPGDTVLDFTMGSGSTGVACVIEGRNFIGIEQDESYCQIAEARIKRAQGIPCDIPRPIKAERHLPLFAENVA